VCFVGCGYDGCGYGYGYGNGGDEWKTRMKKWRKVEARVREKKGRGG
jgi:hypothetical protein